MAVVASLQDFRQTGPPADIGTYEFGSDILVSTHTFAGATYVFALRAGERGWVLVDLLPLTGANATTVILAAINALTAGRTWEETVTVKGRYVGLGQIVLPSYIILEIDGYWEAQDALDTHFITNSDPAGGNTDITIRYGWVNANKENQTGDMSCIHMEKVTRPHVFFMKVRGGARPVGAAHGEGICFWECTLGKIIGNYSYEAYYDNIKVRGSSTYCLIANNTCKDSETKGGIQVSSETTCHNDVIGNIIYQYIHALDNGIRVHSAHDNLIADNKIYAYASTGVQLLDYAYNNTVQGNHIFTNGGGIYVYSGTPASFRPNHNYFVDNTIILATNVATSRGVHIADGDYNVIWKNTIRGAGGGTGVEIGATYCSYNRLGPNYYYNLTTNVTIPADIDVEFIDCQSFCGSSYGEVPGGGAQTFGVLVGKASSNNNEPQMRQIIAKAGIFRNAYVQTNVNIGAGETFHLIYRKNAADQAIDVTMTGAVQTGNDRNHSFTCAAGDLIAVRITETGAVPALHVQWAVQFLPF